MRTMMIPTTVAFFGLLLSACAGKSEIRSDGIESNDTAHGFSVTFRTSTSANPGPFYGDAATVITGDRRISVIIRKGKRADDLPPDRQPKPEESVTSANLPPEEFARFRELVLAARVMSLGNNYTQAPDGPSPNANYTSSIYLEFFLDGERKVIQVGGVDTPQALHEISDQMATLWSKFGPPPNQP